VIDVDDQGPGVPPELVERLFEPFFTTKAPGEGTGLGLTLVAAIVEGHGGSIVVGRSPAGGARFGLRLPVFPEPEGGR
jgi:C4-dicarboxylate-specific signal transduction histidine kinase